MPTKVPVAKPRAKANAVMGSVRSLSTLETANTQTKDFEKCNTKRNKALSPYYHCMTDGTEGNIYHPGRKNDQG